MCAAIEVAIAGPLFIPIGTSGVATAQSLSVGKYSSPNLICDCSCMTVELIAPVTCIHFDAPPLPGGLDMDPDRSSTIIRSGGSPGCSVKFSMPQLSASGV